MVWGKKKTTVVTEVARKELEPPMVVQEPVKKETDNEERYSLETIATQTSIVVFDKATEEKLELQEALVLILNKLDKIENLLS